MMKVKCDFLSSQSTSKGYFRKGYFHTVSSTDGRALYNQEVFWISLTHSKLTQYITQMTDNETAWRSSWRFTLASILLKHCYVRKVFRGHIDSYTFSSTLHGVSSYTNHHIIIYYCEILCIITAEQQNTIFWLSHFPDLMNFNHTKNVNPCKECLQVSHLYFIVNNFNSFPENWNLCR